jgi:DMSO reductase family type II enzyme chaperone
MAGEKHIGIQNERIAIARAIIYRVLARCFAHPDGELIELFSSSRLEEVLQAWRCLGRESSYIDKAANWLMKWPSQQTALLELEKEYTRLFITAYPRVVAPPYSSVYLDKEQFVWGKSTAEAARLYEAAGLGMNRNYHDIPDHIAAELEFVSYLIAEQQKGDEQGSPSTEQMSALEKRFLTEHLYKWVQAFFNRVAEYSRMTFYGMIAELASMFIEWDIEYISRN